jgi:hypothetical protein
MKKNLIKVFITVSILLTTFYTNTLAQNAIGGEKLQKLLTENHIIIYNFLCPLRNNVELNFDASRKTYARDGFFQCRDGDIPDKNFIHPSSGTWELVDSEKDVIQLDDIQNKYTNQVTRIQLLFGDDGNIYNLNNKLYSYRLENKKERIENNARRIEAEELKLKKIEEEKRQLAIKREQEKIRAEQLKIKQDEEKRRLEEEREIIRKKEAEEEAKLKRKKFWKDALFFIIVSAFIVGSYYYINKFHKKKIVIYKNQIITKLKNIWSNKWGKVLIIFVVFLLIQPFFPKSKIDESSNVGYLNEGIVRPVPNTQNMYIGCVYDTKDGKRFYKTVLNNRSLHPCPQMCDLKTGECSSF